MKLLQWTMRYFFISIILRVGLQVGCNEIDRILVIVECVLWREECEKEGENKNKMRK